MRDIIIAILFIALVGFAFYQMQQAEILPETIRIERTESARP